MKVYFSSWQGGIKPREKRLLAAGITHRCFSFINVELVPEIKSYYIARIVSGFEYATRHAGIMMDSGVFSLRRYIARMAKSGMDFKVAERRFVRQYAEYCKANQHKWDFYMTCDFRPSAPEIFKSHVELEKLGVRPVPAYHADDSIEYLKRYRDRGYSFIGIGLGKYIKHKRRHLDAMFNFAAKHGIEYHGLAVTAPWALLGYNWASVDSSSWSRVAAVGGIMIFDSDTGRMGVLHVSDQIAGEGRKSMHNMTGDAVKRLARETEAQGFDLQALRTDFVERHIWNAQQTLRLAAEADRRHRKASGGFRRLI